MVSLNTFNYNLYLWRCIAVHNGERPYRSTRAARELVKSSLKLAATPNNIEKASIDELDNVERHLNREKCVSECLGIKVYEPERQVEQDDVNVELLCQL